MRQEEFPGFAVFFVFYFNCSHLLFSLLFLFLFLFLDFARSIPKGQLTGLGQAMVVVLTRYRDRANYLLHSVTVVPTGK